MENKYEVFYGKLGKNPELKYTLKREPLCNLSIAVNLNNPESTIWKQVVVWGKQAELASVQLKKGSDVFVQGRMNTREYTDKDGNQKTYKEINARLIGFSNI